jgi:hypothetical protein
MNCAPEAGVAQLVEQLIRNQQVTRSSRVAGSTILSKVSDFKVAMPYFCALTHYLTRYPKIASICRAAFAAVCCWRWL